MCKRALNVRQTRNANKTTRTLPRQLAHFSKSYQAGQMMLLTSSFSIQAKSPSDFLDIKQRRKQAARSRLDDLLDKRYERSYLEFSRTTADVECPSVHIVTYLSIRGLRKERVIEPASSIFIASKLPRLNRVELLIGDKYKRDERLRQRL